MDNSTTEFVQLIRKFELQDAKSGDGDKPPVRLFERENGYGCYFAVYGEHARMVSMCLWRSKEHVKTLGQESSVNTLPYVVVQPRRLGKLISELLSSKRLRVELWHLEESGQWVINKKASPGNTDAFNELLESSDNVVESAVVAALQVRVIEQQRHVGLACIDTKEKQIRLCSFVDNSRLSNLESALLQVTALECIIPSKGGFEYDVVTEITEQCQIELLKQDGSKFDAQRTLQDMNHLLSDADGMMRGVDKHEHSMAMGSLTCLVQYLELDANDEVRGQYKLTMMDLGQFMKLDNAAVKALNMFASSVEANKEACLYGLLNKCKSSIGSRLLLRWMKQPLVDLERIQERLNMVQLLFENAELRDYLRTEVLRRVPDLERLKIRLCSGKGGLKDCVALYYFIIRLPALAAVVEENMASAGSFEMQWREQYVEPIKELSDLFVPLIEMIEQTIDLDAAKRLEYIVNAAFSSELTDLKQRKDEIEADLEKEREEIVADLDVGDKNIKLSQKDPLGWHFRIVRSHEKKIRTNRKYNLLQSRKDGVLFTTNVAQSLNKQHREYSREYSHLQKEIATKAVEIAATYSPLLDRAEKLLSELDVYASFAHVSCNAPEPYVRPELLPLGSGLIDMRDARHPCMEILTNVSFIANNVLLEEGTSKFQIISGPNAGGKSTYIRQVGVIALMAQIGCFVPCSSARLSLVDSILARVGAGDSQLRGLSTFMSEMLEASTILKAATKNSLLIVDELGRGTSTYDGFGLAWAISEYIAEQVGAFTLFATHFHELAALAQQVPSVVNKHVSALTTDTSITMMYQIADGPCDRSFGIHVAELAKFPASVVKMAREKALELETFGENDIMDTSETHLNAFAAEQSQTVDALLQQLRSLDLSNMNDAELLDTVKQLIQHA